MIIRNFQKINKDKKCIISADFIFSSNKKRSVYFSIDQKYECFLSLDVSCFLATALIPSMKLGEDIYCEGSISKVLLSNLEKMMDIEAGWNIGLKKIKINIHTDDTNLSIGTNIGSFFSGGVDSFYTFLKNQRNENQKITHFILGHGFDIPVQNTKEFATVEDMVNTIAKKEDVDVVVVTTNIREFMDEIIVWGFVFGSALGATSLLLQSGFKTIYIPSSHDHNDLFPWGSHPDIDPLWSTNNLQVIHDGVEASRIQKTLNYISKSDIALKYLRVCWKNVHGEYNCGVCSKCIRTMIDLRIAGVLEKCTTFKKQLTVDMVSGLDARELSSRLFFIQSLEFLENKNQDIELQNSLKFLLYEKKYGYMTKIRDSIATLDKKYNKNRMYKFLSKRGII